MNNEPEFSDNAKDWMKRWGNFGVIHRGDSIKGWAYIPDYDDYERVYWNTRDLLSMAEAATEIAGKLSK